MRKYLAGILSAHHHTSKVDLAYEWIIICFVQFFRRSSTWFFACARGIGTRDVYLLNVYLLSLLHFRRVSPSRSRIAHSIKSHGCRSIHDLLGSFHQLEYTSGCALSLIYIHHSYCEYRITRRSDRQIRRASFHFIYHYAHFSKSDKLEQYRVIRQLAVTYLK